MASGIKRSGNRPKTAAHLRSPQKKAHVNRTAEEREREHTATDAWAARRRVESVELSGEGET